MITVIKTAEPTEIELKAIEAANAILAEEGLELESIGTRPRDREKK